jgi:integrase/recombinase XerD
MKHYNMHTLQFLGWLDIENVESEQVTGREVTGYMQHLKKKGNGSVARNVQLMALKHFFDYEIKCERRIDNPARHVKLHGVKQRKLHTIFTRQELEALYHNYTIPTAEDPRANRNWFTISKLSKQRNKVILGLMIYQGLTTPEVNDLKTEDVKLREGKIVIEGSRKSEARTLELKPHQVMELMEYQLLTRTELLKYANQSSTRYFIGLPSAGKKNSAAGSTVYIWKAFSKELEQQNEKFKNFQQVRASVITHWLSQYNLRQVQYMAGHRYISTTEKYQANQMEDLQIEIEKFHPIG